MNENTSIVENPVVDKVTQKNKVLGAFQGDIKPVRVPITYRLGILLVAVVMIILPILYLAITALVGYGVYYHAINDTDLLEMGRGKGRLLAILIYVAPMIIGAIMVLFMFKPLLSRPAKRSIRNPLSPDQEPLLFAFVQRLCEAVRAPMPKQIEADCEVNASASFRKGFLSMLGNDLVLTIGMPLVAGLNLRQFAGVLAHEFGHFSQGTGMRLTYIIRTISHWFTRVVYERDKWDEYLVEWAERADLRVGWILHMARMFVWITRKVLWGLMMIGNAVSCIMLRQMEFDADRNEARVAGSKVFASTSRRIVALSIASQGARADLGDFYREGRLGDSSPKLILHNINKFTPDVYSKIDAMVDESTTGFFDTHPADKDRIASANRENAEGVFQLEASTSILFSNFDQLCEQVTWEFYSDIFGENLKREEIHPIDELLERQEQEQESFNALDRYFQGTFMEDRPLQMESWSLDTPIEPQQVVKELKSSRKQMLQSVSKYREDYFRYREASPSAQEKMEQELTFFENLGGERLMAGLRLLFISDIAGKLEKQTLWQKESENLLPSLKLLNDEFETIAKLATGNRALADFYQKLSEDNENSSLISSLQTQADLNNKWIVGIRKTLGASLYPFDHARGEITIGEFALAELPDESDLGDIYNSAESLVFSVSHLRSRLVGQLSLIAEQIELVLGLKPLPKPERTAEKGEEA